ncbi:MAG TPA: glycoside hydrolase family 44 protein, partial [Dyadobacter sp.]|nr:glycoside hydrolase family 44 protein [Dyadobacter sp.]
MQKTIQSAKSLAFATALLCLFQGVLLAQTTVEIDADAEVKSISPYLYGRNNSFSSTNPNWTLPAEDLVRLTDAGVTFFRESGGNNSSKYNWRKKLSSHPDWYNNVYTNNWDQAAQTLQKNFPEAQGMWAFPLLGYAAKTNSANFADWDYNRSQWWEGVSQNLAGKGTPNFSGTKAKVEGDINLYLEKWDADSAVAILDHWFSDKGLSLKKEKIRYWNVDNEPEIWSGTHDDVMPKQITAQEFMQRYITLAKKAKAKDPEIKLVGPVTANEWQWYNWDGKTITENGKNYPWLEYFIKTVADEQKKSGVRLLDVLDIHFYPSSKKAEEIVQMHRVYFDKTYNFPEANGVKTINGGYDNNITKEYIFARCNDWLTQHMGAGHGVTLGVTETGIDDSITPSVTAVWYASTIGEFMKNGVEIFTPWTWKTGMWETLHLMSRYNQTSSIKGISSNETMVSVYPSLNGSRD